MPQTSSSTSESCPVTFLWVPLLVSSLVLGVGGAATAPHATFPTAPHPVPEELLGFAGFSLRKTSCLLVFFCQLAFDKQLPTAYIWGYLFSFINIVVNNFLRDKIEGRRGHPLEGIEAGCGAPGSLGTINSLSTLTVS